MFLKRSINTASDRSFGVITLHCTYSKAYNDTKKKLIDDGYDIDESNSQFNELQAKKNNVTFTITLVQIDEKDVEVEIISFVQKHSSLLKKETRKIYSLLNR